MNAAHSDEGTHKRGGGFRVLQVDGQWCVAGPGYLSMVDGYAEGVQLIEKLRAEAERHRASVRQRQDINHAT